MEKVVVGMSGGIDSTMTAYLLKEQGYEVIGVTLKHLGEDYDNDSNSKTCCSLDDIADARSACFNLGIRHYVIDAQEEFKKEVIDYFLEEYSKGRTPSPCVICDEKIKIKKLINFADKIGASYIATGHYSKLTYDKDLEAYFLQNAEDVKKDQSYMLYRLDEASIKRILLPLSTYKKQEIRALAENIGIKSFNKKDSQGICFAPEGYIEYLKRHLKGQIKEGNFLDKFGNFMGKHKGYQLYTIGQRRGLDLKLPRAYFIIDIIPEKNEIILGDFEELQVKEVRLSSCKFVVDFDKIKDLELLAKARFSSSGSLGYLKKIANEIYFIFNEYNTECARGQHLVLTYDGKVLGGGIIE